MITLTKEDIAKIGKTNEEYLAGLTFWQAVTDSYKYESEHSIKLSNGKWEFMNHTIPTTNKTTTDIYIKKVKGTEYIYIIGSEEERYTLTPEYKQILGL